MDDKHLERTEKERAVQSSNQHQVMLKRREDLLVDGVTNVESFDDQEVIVETVAGVLIVRGEDLHINQLNLDTGSVSVKGFIASLEYVGETLGQKGKGVLGRLFR